MEWGNVTVEELVNALKEVEWSSPPRPLSEFFAKFTSPKTLTKWNSRLKCNLYFYRTNYFILIVFLMVLGIAFVQSYSAMLATILTSLGIACLNDSFAISLSERLTRVTRRIYPPLAAKLRPPLTPGNRRPSKGAIYICGRDRRIIVIGLLSVSVLLWFLSSALKVMFGALALGVVLTLLHASFRSPNLKARLNTFREEFRAVWRSYSDA